MTKQPDRSGLVLAIECATDEGLVALGRSDGELIAHDRWAAGHAHGQRLLGSVEKVLAEAGSSLDDVGAIVVGMGPGSFTGLRVGLAVAKGLAFGLGVAIVGIETPVALATALAGGAGRLDGSVVVLQPAGPKGRYRTLVTGDQTGVHRLAGPPILAGVDEGVAIGPGARLVAVDLPDAPGEARTAGLLARDRLAGTLLRIGAARLASGEVDDLAELVPTYVTLPRGAIAGTGGITWSPARP